MKRIAVTYENGQVFQHFGKTEQFKIYEVENDEIVSSRILDSNGAGHGALATLLAEQKVDVLICGGLGGGAMEALTEAGIEVCAGIKGEADAVVEVYLTGMLKSSGVNCDHHGEGHSCGDHGCGGNGEREACGNQKDGSSCEGGGESSCGGCQGGCGGCGITPLMEGRNVGRTVRVHYRGTFNDGEQFDSSYDRGEPLEFTSGVGMMIRGFDEAVADMEVGQIVDVHLMPEEAYGLADPQAIFTMQIAKLPGSEALNVGELVYLSDASGQPFPVKVAAKDDTNITFDANHEMAGKELNFRIELLEVL